MTDPNELLPDVLETLGVQITEIGGVQVGAERVLRDPGGAGRVSLVLQSAWSGAITIEVAARPVGGTPVERKVGLAHGEVRRIRVPLPLDPAATEVRVHITSAVPSGARRIRQAWIRRNDGGPQGSVLGALMGALRQAVGKGSGSDAPAAGDRSELAMTIEPSAGPLPIATEEEVVWQVGMAAPVSLDLGPRPASELVPKRVVEPPPHVEPASPGATAASPSTGTGERVECPHCHTLTFRELVVGRGTCPSCGQSWNP